MGDTTGLATITQTMPIDVQFSIPQDRVADVQTAATEAGAAGLPVVAKDRTRTTDLAQGRFSTLDNLVDTATVRRRPRRVSPTPTAGSSPTSS